MKRIADELQAATAALSLPSEQPDVLDLCMAPGGYTASVLKYNPRARVASVSLPRALGGHEVLVPHGKKDPRVAVWYIDITMLAKEFGAPEIPDNHPDKENFILDKRPYFGRSFDLVFCDGQVLRTHARSDYREKTEATRLSCSQLILAFQRIKPGGTLIMLLHKLEAWKTIALLYLFDQIAHVQLFKPKRGHATRSSFYLVAKNVQPEHAEAVAAVQGWKETWKAATFPEADITEVANASTVATRRYQEPEIESLLASFGERLVLLGDPIWEIQRQALGNWLREIGMG
jgi:23S rRNA U2552 (ribose-2'-O)-methylase RlmE/FtsJ